MIQLGKNIQNFIKFKKLKKKFVNLYFKGIKL